MRINFFSVFLKSDGLNPVRLNCPFSYNQFKPFIHKSMWSSNSSNLILSGVNPLIFLDIYSTLSSSSKSDNLETNVVALAIL